MGDAINWVVAIVGGFVGGLMAFGGQYLILNLKDKKDKDNATRKQESDRHLRRKERLEAIVASLVELRLLAYYARCKRITVDRAIGGGDKESASWYADRYHELQERVDNLITSCIVDAEHYGSLPAGVNLNEPLLVRYVTAVVASAPREVMTNSDMTESEIRIVNHNISYLIHDLRALGLAESQLAQDALGTTSTFCVPNLPYLQKIEPGTKQPLIKLDELNTSYVDMRQFDTLDKQGELQ